MYRLFKRFVCIAVIFIATGFLLSDSTTHAESQDEGDGQLVHVIPIEKEVERGLEAFLRRTTSEAAEENVDHIIFEINTPGGRVDAANNIGALLQGVDIPMTAYIRSQALSAGSYIALFSDQIYMNPQATMGASGVVTGDGTAADDKAQSYWIEAMGSAAEAKGRDRLYAEAMANADIDLPEYNAPSGSYLTLGPASALEVGYSEGTVNHRTELLEELGLANATVEEIEVTIAEEVARFLTNSAVVSILLSLAGLGLILELYSPGFGVAGSVGVLSILLFFYGHTIAGFAGQEAFILLILGIGLIVAEFFVPGGILGGLGALGVLGSLFMATPNPRQLSISLLIALIITIGVAIYLFQRIGLEKGVFKYIILNDSETPERGYISNQNRHELTHQTGTTLTPLRPAGTALINGERLDVVSEGNFIARDQQITVEKVAGSRIVVRERKEEDN
ncbi:membrane-bound serine protease (ClpP class) [Pelagirhabdus alkalitolerans]|uniref:Membrane-bound serine protease (ClpP class) n=1 Tax=Pelagirhabdus alkalitolerans TaxID=1612202 RepID=A0A1G6HVE6_9BACI|nr:nodulation protein NfeD [Pelagirhabdus alkalitolerans]SDB98191.1 membrane-bound serine protease (ClpP class) [Pelagirhabdus alkalitolerans]